MTAQELETGLYYRLYDFFYDHGFELMADKKQYRRVGDRGFQNVIFSQSAHQDEFVLEVNLGLRFSPIEDIAQQFLDNHVDFRADSNTLIVSIGKLTNNKYFRYKIIDHDDLSLTCDQIADFLEHEGFRFLNEAFSLSNLDKIFNQAPGKACKYLYNQQHRCFKGIVAAKLNHSKQFLPLVEKYQSYLALSGAKPNTQAAFDRLVSFLLHYSDN